MKKLILIISLLLPFCLQAAPVDPPKQLLEKWTAELSTGKGEKNIESYSVNRKTIYHVLSKQNAINSTPSIIMQEKLKQKLYSKNGISPLQKAVSYYLEHKDDQQLTFSLRLVKMDKIHALLKKLDYLHLSDAVLNSYLFADSLTIDYNLFSQLHEHGKSSCLPNQKKGKSCRITLQYLTNGKSQKYDYQTNLNTMVPDQQMAEYLCYYRLNHDFGLFTTIDLRDYFSESNFYTIILRYIAIKEHTL